MKAWEMVSAVLSKVSEYVEPGVSTWQLDAMAEHELQKLGGYSYNKGFFPKWSPMPFPAVLCTSVNNEIAHGIPSRTKYLREGDIVTLDIGVIDQDGDCGDAAIAVPVGELSKEDELLLRYAKKILYAGIEKIQAGVKVIDIARAMEKVALERNFTINRSMTGHAINKQMHEDPPIFHVSNKNDFGTPEWHNYQKYMDITLEAGQIICLEPCVTGGKDPFGVKDPKNGWVWYTMDGRKSAMFEHMIKVLDGGCEVLTTHFKPFRKELN